jgi:hypothetical protein
VRETYGNRGRIVGISKKTSPGSEKNKETNLEKSLDRPTISAILDISGDFLYLDSATLDSSESTLNGIGKFTEKNSFCESHLRQFQIAGAGNLIPGTIALELMLQTGALLVNSIRPRCQAIVIAIEAQFRLPVRLGDASTTVSVIKSAEDRYSIEASLNQGASYTIKAKLHYQCVDRVKS